MYPSSKISIRKSPSRGFTLVELLVVIAIVGLLAALAVPAINRGLFASRVTKSSNNLRQIQLANIRYASEHDDFYVDSQLATGGDIWMWNAEFYPYLGYDRSKFSYNKFPDVFYSPLVARGKLNYTYGYNVTRLVGTPARKSLRISSLSKGMAFCESQDWQVNYATADKYKDGVEKYSALTPAYRVSGKGNAAQALVVFFDGHVESVARSNMVTNTTLWNDDYK
jgi:prepilin-type N-terminal cleavage/methylation domain-containing protein